ncbi:unnamed protein product [Microthlaspi erraticum]|uniref:Uncharacterized protein n=1 Tax=Microthlaspi erraticum TaxID=1685480 RepID=A0A6D2KZL6_9BRAS|nr:unnamed protein product [Microthlaspi erraticum]
MDEIAKARKSGHKEAAKTLVILNHDDRKSVLRAACYLSTDNLKKQCAILGCNLTKKLNRHCCSGGHRKYAEKLSRANHAFHHFEGFTGPANRNIICFSSVVLMSEDIHVGFPHLKDPKIFTTYPWAQPKVFCTTKPPQRCDWLFSYKPPTVYHAISPSTELDIHWKLGSKRPQVFNGHEVKIQNMTLSFGTRKESQELKAEQGGKWTCILYQCKDASLYCLSFAKDAKTLDKNIAQGQGDGAANEDIHRDLNCSNVFVNGNIGQVKIGDTSEVKL